MDGYYSAVLPIMEGPSWAAAAVYVDAAGETEKSTIWLSPKAAELMKPLAVFVNCDDPNPNEVELFLGAGDDFDPITVEMPDDLRPQVIYPAVISHWIAQEIIEMEHAMSDGTREAANVREAIDIFMIGRRFERLFIYVDMLGDKDGLELADLAKSAWPPIEIIVAFGHREVRQADIAPTGSSSGSPIARKPSSFDG